MADGRQAIIARHVKRYLYETSAKMEAFGQDVIDHYAAHTPAGQRHIAVHEHDDIIQRRKLNAQTVRRFFDDEDGRIPVELEDSIIFALPEERRAPLIAELCALWGVVPMPAIQAEGGEISPLTLGGMVQELGEAAGPLSAALADGQITSLDHPLLRKALPELRQLAGKTMGAVIAIEQTLAKAGG